MRQVCCICSEATETGHLHLNLIGRRISRKLSLGILGLKALGVVLDPLNYKEWLRVPKLVVDATGDEFFMPDDDWFWWKDMSDRSAGEIYRLMVDNAEHSFATVYS